MLPRWFPNRKDPADGNFIEKHIRSIANFKSSKVLFVKGLNQDVDGEIEIKEPHSQLEYFSFYFTQNQSRIKGMINAIKYFRAEWKLYAFIRKKHGMPEICHVHVNGRSALLAFYLKKRYKIPYVLSEHWSGYYPESKKMNFFKAIFFTWFLKNADARTAVSDSLAQAMKKLSPSQKIDVIPNVVDDIYLDNEYSEKKSQSHKTLLHISNLIPEIKQTDQLLILLNELAGNRSDFTIKIIGDGPAKEKLEVLSNSLNNLTHRIEFLGDVNAETLKEEFKHADATLSFSKFETQSIVLLESIAMGVPVVAPNIGGIPEHCSDRGILFEVNNAQAFKESVNRMLSNDFKWNAQESKKYITQNFKSNVVASKFLDVYDNVMKKHAE